MLDLQVPKLSPCSSSVAVTMIQPRVIKQLPFLESGMDPWKHCLCLLFDWRTLALSFYLLLLLLLFSC